MNVLIVEDEVMAQRSLARVLTQNFPDFNIVGFSDSVKGTVAWLNDPANKADIIFMDVELSDGICFEIFRQTEVRAKVIMTTAYDSYALKAFETGSVDYLLKPIDPEALKRAVSRCRTREDHLIPVWVPFPDLFRFASEPQRPQPCFSFLPEGRIGRAHV